MKKKFVATVSGVVAVIGLNIAICSPAQAEPFVRCPFDPSAGPQAQKQYFDQKTAQLVAMQNDVNTRILGPMSNAERDAWAASPAGLAEVARENQVVKERDNLPQSCHPLQPVPAAPYFNPEPLPPSPGDAPQIDDTNMPGPSSEVDCTKLRAAYDSLGPVLNAADAAAELNHLKIPGVSQVTGTSLAQCGLDAIPAAIANPSPDNEQRVFDGACGAVDQFTEGIINPCGDTPVGAH